jgi:3',5'-cyclic-AMP phosphodiesterase
MAFARRSFLQSLFAGFGGWAGAQAAGASSAESQPFRAAFLTDTHLPAGKPDIAGRVTRLIDAIQARPKPPGLFIFGGDNVFAVDGGQTVEQTTEQFRLWKEIVQNRLSVPSVSVIGNHDIRWKERSADRPEEFREKSRAVAAYGMPARYYRTEHGGWTFLLLDTFQWSGCELDDDQWTWLAQQLSEGDSPVCIVTHSPLLSATHFLEPGTDKGKGYSIPAGWSPQGLVRFRELFRQHARVKLCLSGHMHTCDRVEIDQTAYVCGGAVSGNWWGKGDYLGFGPCWMEFLLYPDGRWTHERRAWA